MSPRVWVATSRTRFRISHCQYSWLHIHDLCRISNVIVWNLKKYCNGIVYPLVTFLLISQPIGIVSTIAPDLGSACGLCRILGSPRYFCPLKQQQLSYSFVSPRRGSRGCIETVGWRFVSPTGDNREEKKLHMIEELI